MIGLDISTIPKLVVRWIMLECYYVVDLILDSVWIILAFYCRLFYLTLHVFKNFYQRMNKPNVRNNIGSILGAFQVSKIGITNVLAQLVSILRAKL